MPKSRSQADRSQADQSQADQGQAEEGTPAQDEDAEMNNYDTEADLPPAGVNSEA